MNARSPFVDLIHCNLNSHTADHALPYTRRKTRVHQQVSKTHCFCGKWWWTQSRAIWSQVNSLFYRKRTGNLLSNDAITGDIGRLMSRRIYFNIQYQRFDMQSATFLLVCKIEILKYLITVVDAPKQVICSVITGSCWRTGPRVIRSEQT